MGGVDCDNITCIWDPAAHQILATVRSCHHPAHVCFLSPRWSVASLPCGSKTRRPVSLRLLNLECLPPQHASARSHDEQPLCVCAQAQGWCSGSRVRRHRLRLQLPHVFPILLPVPSSCQPTYVPIWAFHLSSATCLGFQGTLPRHKKVGVTSVHMEEKQGTKTKASSWREAERP